MTASRIERVKDYYKLNTWELCFAAATQEGLQDPERCAQLMYESLMRRQVPSVVEQYVHRAEQFMRQQGYGSDL